MKRKRNGVFFLVLGMALVFGAIGLSVYNVWDASRAAAASFRTMAALDEAIEPVGASKPEDFIGAADEVEIPYYILNPNMEMPVLEIDGRRYIGYLEIPVLGLSLPELELFQSQSFRLLLSGFPLPEQHGDRGA